MRIAMLLLFFLIVLAAVVLWAKILTGLACPRCGSKNITPAEDNNKHAYGTKWECLNSKCSKVFYFLPLISYKSSLTNVRTPDN